MGIIQPDEMPFAAAVAKLNYCNPFLQERIANEREALGEAFVSAHPVWNVRADVWGERPNVLLLRDRTEALLQRVRERIVAGNPASARELELYQDLALYALYHRCSEKLSEIIGAAATRPATRKVEYYRQYREEFEHLLGLPQAKLRPRYEPAHLFASFFQIRRAFYHIFRHIVGGSMPAARLRASVWESIFTADTRRYQRVLYNRMADFMTLVVGPSGTGKELVARAVGLSRYIPFDVKSQSFTEDFRGSFHALNLCALSPTLIESELFGHRRGAFTGALEDRAGWLEVCGALGTVFLDEVCEIGAAIQVKLLRVLQTRTFQRLGDTQTRQFQGKIIAATNRDPAREMAEGRLREDFYYRLCSDMITTPSLREILHESPEELRNLVLFIAQRMLGLRGEEEGAGEAHQDERTAEEAERLSDQVVRWIQGNLGEEYGWQGNFRELEQCVRNLLIRGTYRPPLRPAVTAASDLSNSLEEGQLTADELLRHYCTLVYARTGSYEETARRLGLDRRTVKSRVNASLLKELNGERRTKGT